MMFGTHRHLDSERARRREEQWAAMPLEGKIALIAVPASVILVSNLAHLVPQIRDAGLAEEVSAGGMAIALLTGFLIQMTFGKAAAKRAEERRQIQTSVPRALQGGAPDPVLAPVVVDRTLQSTLAKLEAVHRHDPGFSQSSLSQFSQTLLERIAAMVDGQERSLSPYATPVALQDVRRRCRGGKVVPGPARIVDVTETEVWTSLKVEQPFLIDGPEPRRVAMTWVLRRSGAARSPAPVDLLGFACPACGAPVQVTHPDGHCTTCDTGITHGQLSWQVVDVSGAPQAAWIGFEEKHGGGEHPSLLPLTLEAKDLPAGLRGMATRHPEVPPAAIEKRAAEAAVAWYQSRLLGNARSAKGLFHETLEQALRYELVRADLAGLAVRGGPVKVDQVEWARAEPDGWHETADLRVYLSLPWSLTSAEGEVLDGDPDQPRSMSVYVRLVHPTARTASIDGWRAWQISDARIYGR